MTALSYGFMQNAIVAGVLASVLCGVIGTFVVAKRMVFISGGISHAAFGGLGICHFLGAPPLLGAVAVSIGCALILGLTGGTRAQPREAMIGVLWAVGMATGIVFIHATPGYAPDLMGILFGDILTVSPLDLAVSLGLDLLVVSLLVVFFKEIVATCFDESFAAVQGVPVRTLRTGLLVLVAISVVTLIQVVGIILVIALLTIPPLVGLGLARHFVGALWISVVTGLAMTLSGLALSYRFDLPSGPIIILVGAALLAAVAVGRATRGPGERRASPR